MKVFSRQGGFYMDKLPLPFRLIMKVKNKEIAERVRKKPSQDARDQALLNMALTGNGDPASWEVEDIVAWCRAQN